MQVKKTCARSGLSGLVPALGARGASPAFYNFESVRRCRLIGLALARVRLTERQNMIIEALKSLLIGIVEGVTEWLPISSTGHMILVDDFVQLQVSPEFLALFLVVIQIGAILAVLTLYFHKLNPLSPQQNADEKRATWRLWGMVAIGCVPAAVVGILLDDWVNAHFYNKVTVAAMLILYGVVFIVMEGRNRRRMRRARAAVQNQARARVEQPSVPCGRHARVQAPSRPAPAHACVATSTPRQSAASSVSPMSTTLIGRRP